MLSELETLRERVAVLEYELQRRDADDRAEVAAVMLATGMPERQIYVLKALATGRYMTRDTLALLGRLGDDCQIRSVDSIIKKIRKRLRRAMADPIKSLYGVGYCVEAHRIAEVHDFMKGNSQ